MGIRHFLTKGFNTFNKVTFNQSSLDKAFRKIEKFLHPTLMEVKII